MKSILDARNLQGKRVLVRVDWSVPAAHGEVITDWQIKQSFHTIEYLQKTGAKVVLISHSENDQDSLEPIFDHVRKFLPLTFNSDSNLTLLENLRRNPGEKANSEEFAKKLASKADLFVNEAFAESHREYASIVGVPKFLPSFAGLRLAREIQELSKAFYPKHPFLFIIGGAKFDTKLPLLQKFVDIADDIFVGGALAHDFFKEIGRDIGDSLVSNTRFEVGKLLNTGKIMLPSDTIVQHNKILDAGPLVLEELKEKINAAKLVLWNGPLGAYEMGYKVGTLGLAQLIAESGNESIVGGGDTLAAIQELNLLDKFSFVSTGGGAMITFLATGTLPGIEALK